MAFGFFGRRTGILVGIAAVLASLPFGIGFLSQYPVLTASLLAYAVSTILCVALSWNSDEDFDFSTIAEKTRHFDDVDPMPVTKEAIA
ncbi:hypothetical protein QWZ10_20075 [Paracoccus cavernae]|uniref:MFS transporter n=2 Tax=Paracoccus cavernae TaxID=1571207 RepID=A0ABT8DC45_9RHOB|nr:hypothetical protein [Paracoccus cavernae]